jgi:hypothetical protein
MFLEALTALDYQNSREFRSTSIHWLYIALTILSPCDLPPVIVPPVKLELPALEPSELPEKRWENAEESYMSGPFYPH